MESLTSEASGITTLRHSSDLQASLIEYASHIGEFRTPNDVLDALHVITSKNLPLCVLGAVRFPLKAADWHSVQLGKSVFLHKDVPEGWWEEHAVLSPGRFSPNLFLAKSSLASYTWTEVQHLFEPVGIDRWSFDLALKHGMLDLSRWRPLGGGVLVAEGSLKDPHAPFPDHDLRRCQFAALRLEQLVGPDVARIGASVRLTNRELAVLRLMSMGRQTPAIAQELGLGEETIRTHLKKAEAKLGVHNRTHAACEALRNNLIP